jgi:hypothetical protein
MFHGTSHVDLEDNDSRVISCFTKMIYQHWEPDTRAQTVMAHQVIHT